MNVFSACSGIGGLDLGLERAGMTVVAQVEIDEFCQRVLAHHWPEAAHHDDIHTALDWWFAEPRPRVDVVAGGPPCQPVSVAGKGEGREDSRWLWDPFLALVDHLRPEWVVWENVSGLRTRGLDVVHAAFLELGYRHTVGTASACSVGAPHPRSRLLGVAHAPRFRRRTGRPWGPAGQAPHRADLPAQGVDRRRAETRPGAGHWASEPRVARLVDGLPRELVERAGRAFGNAVVPAVGERIGRLITSAVSAPLFTDKEAER